MNSVERKGTKNEKHAAPPPLLLGEIRERSRSKNREGANIGGRTRQFKMA